MKGLKFSNISQSNLSLKDILKKLLKEFQTSYKVRAKSLTISKIWALLTKKWLSSYQDGPNDSLKPIKYHLIFVFLREFKDFIETKDNILEHKHIPFKFYWLINIVHLIGKIIRISAKDFFLIYSHGFSSFLTYFLLGNSSSLIGSHKLSSFRYLFFSINKIKCAHCIGVNIIRIPSMISSRSKLFISI